MRSPRPFPFRFGVSTCELLSLGVFGVLALVSQLGVARAGTLAATMDGHFDEWSSVSPVWTDPAGDGSTVDFRRLWLADDARFLFLRIEVTNEIQLDESNSLVVYLDTDNNAGTGLAVGGIGAELEWKLGLRQGKYYRGTNPNVFQNDLRFRGFSTVSDTQFEMCFGRDTEPDGTNPLFLGSTLKILWKDTASGGDQLPNSGSFVTYNLDQGDPVTTIEIPFDKEQAADLRVSTQNAHNDGLYDGALQPKFRRLYQATQPEIINLQEIYDHPATETRNLFTSWLGGTWYAADVNDCQTISRYPIEGTWAIDGNLAILLDTSAALGQKMLIINCHLPCCTDESGRQREVDHILQFLRDAMYESGGLLDIPAGTVIAPIGDMNFVGVARSLRSLLTGDIVDEALYGEDFDPDWDGSDFADLVSRQTEKRMAYTWRSDTSTFWPGRLDFMIHTDSAVTIGNHYLVYTHEMSGGSLSAHGLQAADSDASDHLLQVADLRPTAPSETGEVFDPTIPLRLLPNPMRNELTIRFRLPREERMRVEVLDVAGRRVSTVFDGVAASDQVVDWDGLNTDGAMTPTGAYFVRLSDSTDRTRATERLVVLR